MEIWKPIPNFDMYSVSTYGRVKSTKKRKGSRANVNDGIVKGWIQKPQSKYSYERAKVSLRKDGKTYEFMVHTLVLTTFVGKAPEGCICRHLDGNPLNNNLCNLKWGTRKENYEDSVSHGTNTNPPKHLGESHPNARHPDELINSIRGKVFKRGEIKALAKKLGVNPITISRWRNSTEGSRGY